ncbi:hypothetical protein [Psychrobacter sp. JCM 18901]|nr:hypothetical protein [Psychrobacter sp. JCM 18901]
MAPNTMPSNTETLLIDANKNSGVNNDGTKKNTVALQSVINTCLNDGHR